MLVPGKIENISMIIDCKELGVFNAPYSLFKNITELLQEIYKCRLRTIYSINESTSFAVIWNTITFGKTTVNKIIRSESECSSKILKDIDFT